MILKNARHPRGITLKPRPTVVNLKPLVCRKMTAEERERYGVPRKKGRSKDESRRDAAI